MTEIILASVITFFIIGAYLFIKKRKSKSMENIDNPAKEEEKSISQTISDFKSRRSYVPSKKYENKSYLRSSSYYSDTRSKNSSREDNSDFLISMAIANATDSALMGTLIGGDPLGAMVGDMLNHSDDSPSSFSHDSSYSNDNSYSNDSFSNDSYSSDSFSSDSSSFSSDF